MLRTVHRQRKRPLLKEPPPGRLHASSPNLAIPAARIAPDAEWLEADGLGGFASGSVLGARTRRYHALLLTATTPPTGRLVQVNGVEAHVETDEGVIPISTSEANAVPPPGCPVMKRGTSAPVRASDSPACARSNSADSISRPLEGMAKMTLTRQFPRQMREDGRYRWRS